jgi:hypothetical protein
MLYLLSGIRTHNVSDDIGTDCIGSHKSNYHAITTMMAPKNYILFEIELELNSAHVLNLDLEKAKVSSTNKIDHHNITEILLKVALNTITKLYNTYCL